MKLEAWLGTQPRDVAVAFAVRAALRVLPLVWTSRNEGAKGEFSIDIVLPVFRGTAVAWVMARYPDQHMPLFRATGAAAVASASTPRTPTPFVVIAATSAATAANSATLDNAAASAARAVDAAARAAYAIFGKGFSLGFNLNLSSALGAEPVTAAFWSALSIDATRVEDSWSVSDIAGSPLWPQGQPEQLQSFWLEMKTALLAARQDWEVWTIWYDDRLAGRVRDAERELAYVRIEEALWNQGPAIVNAEIKRRIAMSSYEDRLRGGTTDLEADLAYERIENPVPPEPSPELGPVLQVTERGLEIISQPSEDKFDEDLQKALHGRLRRLLPALTDATHRVANAHPALDHIVSEYSDLVSQPFDQLDVSSLWAVGTGLLAFRSAFANQASGTMTEPLEPGHFALLQQAAEMHGGFILGFPKGRELTERADHVRLSPEIIAQIAPPARRILEELARANDFVEVRTRKFLAAVDESLIFHGWETARIGHAIYVTTRNSLIALGKYLIIANIGCAAILGKPILPSLDSDPHTTQQIIEFLMHNAQDVLSFAEPFPELRNWIGFLIDHLDREK